MESKWIAKSLTIWGGIVVALPGLAAIIGLELPDVEVLQSAGVAVIEGAATIVGLVMVVIGRLRANTGAPVTLKP
jgi:hypothetical protein